MSAKDLIINEAFLSSIETLIFVKNKAGAYIYCNQSFANFLGMFRDKILGHTVHDMPKKRAAIEYEAAGEALFEVVAHQKYYSSTPNVIPPFN